MRGTYLQRQRGVAVITALLLATLAITIVASLFWQQQVQVRSIENQRLQLQKQWILRGALDWARLILREDAKFSSVDSLDEPWAVPLSETRLDQYVENGQADADAADATLSGGVEDAQARYNLANLSTAGTVDPGEVAVYERLLTNVQLGPELAARTAQFIAQSQAKPEQSQQNSSTRPMALAYVDDLLAVPGYSQEALAKLSKFVIFLPKGDTTVNANTASAEVLAAKVEGLSLSEASTLVASRTGASFRNAGDITNRLQGKQVLGSALETRTNYFLVHGNVKMSRAGLTVEALVERNGTNTKLVWIRDN
jgi:general secretion pathway protein K